MWWDVQVHNKPVRCTKFADVVKLLWICNHEALYIVVNRGFVTMLGIGLMVRVADLRSWGPEFKSPLAVELIPGGFDSACHPSEGGKNEYQLAGMIEPFEYPASEWRLSRIVSSSPGDCFGSTDALHRVWSQCMNACMVGYCLLNNAA